MSRCFPFPPPGYEEKTTKDDVDLLKKEKHKEKKQKKEKSDSKDKREKDRSEGKDREKKDKKEKHGDKKKDKEKNVDKNNFNSSTADEKKPSGKPEGHNGELLGQIGKISYSNEKKFSGKFVGDTEDKINQKYHLVEDIKHSKFVQELDKRISVGGNGAMDQSATQKFMGIDPRKDEAVLRVVAKDFGNGAERKDRKMDGYESRDVPEPNENTKLYNLPGFVQGKFEGTPGPSNKNVEKKMEGKDKTKRESDDKRGDKDKEKKSKSKDKNSEKEKKSKTKDKNGEKEKKSKTKDKNGEKEKKSNTKDKNGEKEKRKEVKYEAKTTEQDKFKDSDKKEQIGIYSSTVPVISKGNDMAAAIQESLRMRKDLGENGFFHDSGEEAPEVPDGRVNPQLHSGPDISLNKLAYPVSSHSFPLVENGRVLEPWTPPNRKGISINHIVDKKKQKVNSVIEEGQLVSFSPGKPSPATSKPKKISVHPDSKYLDQILTVPKMQEWSDFDDPEWLLSSNKTPLKKPKVGDFSVNETPQVWDKAMLIDSADICALPYVIPY